MTKEWLSKIYEQVGADFMQAQIDSLLKEFRYLGATNENSIQPTAIDHSIGGELDQRTSDG
jgi:hypothetical protein